MADRDGWVSDDELSAAAQLSHDVYGPNAASTTGISAAFAKRQARTIFEENAAMAATTLVTLAKSAQNESVRLKAAESILNRALGTPRPADTADEKDKLDQLFDKLAENDYEHSETDSDTGSDSEADSEPVTD